MARQSIEVITTWYNEEFLAPFFLNHYAFADRILVLYDEDTTDKTMDIINAYPNTRVETFRFTDGFDDDITVSMRNAKYAESEAGWVIGVDADEFILHPDLREFLHNRDEDIFFVRLFQVYRHKDDEDLDPEKPIADQRRHGDANAVGGQNRGGQKPLVVRAGLSRMKWQPGHHNIWNRHKYVTSRVVLPGVHWHMADPGFCIERRLRGPLRQGEQNRLRGHGCHWNVVTEEQIVSELERHRNDPRVL